MKTYLPVFLLLLFAFPAAAADVRATWDPVTLDEQGGQENIGHYMLYWGQTPRPGNVTRPTDPGFSYDEERNVGNTTSSQQSNFTPGQTYYFAVAAVDVGGNISAYSLEVEVTIPSDQDGGVDGGGEDAGVDAGADPGADEPPADRPGADEEIVLEGTCGCSGGSNAGLWLVALLVAPLIRRKRE